LRNTEFQSQLVEEFIQAIGVYPTGSLVHLSNQEVGVVIAQNAERRLRPKCWCCWMQIRRSLSDGRPRYVDMMTTTHDGRGEPLRIMTESVAWNVWCGSGQGSAGGLIMLHTRLGHAQLRNDE
jgi:hypothetical protein